MFSPSGSFAQPPMTSFGGRSTEAPFGLPIWGSRMPPPVRPNAPPPDQDERIAERIHARDRLVVSVDFGTTHSGVAYSSSTLTNAQTRLVLTWPGTYETHRKIPTCLVYDNTGNLLNWGLEAQNRALEPGMRRCEYFRLFLEPDSLKGEASAQTFLPELPPGKLPSDLVTDFLTHLWDHAKEMITKDAHYTGSELERAEVYLTVPPTWNREGIATVREAAIAAGVVQRTSAGDMQWRERLHIMTKSEAAFVHCTTEQVHPLVFEGLKPGNHCFVCTAGGRTVEVASYKFTGEREPAIADIAEMPPAKRVHSCGSAYLDVRFRELVKILLEDHPAHTDESSLAYLGHQFSDVEKLTFGDAEESEEDDTMFNFACFNAEDWDDPAVGLINGELCIPGRLLRREVFEPVVDEVIRLVDSQISLFGPPQSIFLVGGFSQSPYLLKRVMQKFNDRVALIHRPSDADTSALRGAITCAISGGPFKSRIVVPRSYVLKVRLPAEQEDWMKRPAYIKQSNTGGPLCENRLQYLVKKGSIVVKGEPILTKFSKLSKSRRDSTFTTRVYTDTSDATLRYTDEGSLEELYRWKVDLSALPGFQGINHFGRGSEPGFYTEFEIGLEIENQDVSAVVLYNGVETARASFRV